MNMKNMKKTLVGPANNRLQRTGAGAPPLNRSVSWP